MGIHIGKSDSALIGGAIFLSVASHMFDFSREILRFLFPKVLSLYYHFRVFVLIYMGKVHIYYFYIHVYICGEVMV